MKRVVGKWLTTHCPHAKTLLAACLVPPRCLKDALEKSAEAGKSKTGFLVTVQTASGTLLGRFEFQDGLTTISDVAQQVAVSAPMFPTSQQVMCRLGDSTKLSRNETLADVVGSEVAARSRSVRVVVELVVMLMFGWDRSLSGSLLTFSNEDSTVTRPAETGRFPRAVGRFELRRPGDCFGVKVDSAPKCYSALSIGVTRDSKAFDGPLGSGCQPVIGGVEGTAGYYMPLHNTTVFGTFRWMHNGVQRKFGGAERLMAEGDCLRFELVQQAHRDDFDDDDDAGGGSENNNSGGDHSRTSWDLRVSVNGEVVCRAMQLPAGFNPRSDLWSRCPTMVE